MSRPATIEIDLAAIRSNYQLAERLAPASSVLAIIKADAFGHGAVKVAQTLAFADAFGVACIEEALELREAGIEHPILLLEGFFESDELSEISTQEFWSVVHSAEQVEALEKANLSKPINVWLKIDTSMHRLGILPEHFNNIYHRLRHCKNVYRITFTSHFSCADELDNNYTLNQQKDFERCITGLSNTRSLANSAATLAWPQSHSDWVRPGIMLYGSSPFSVPNDNASQMHSAMTLRSRIIAERTIDPHKSIGYGKRWHSQRTTRVGTVAIGYGDGYPRNAPDGTPVLIEGKRSQLIGRVCMDMILVDLTDIPTAGVGSSVELWGKELSVNEVADAAETTTYELLTRLTRRPRRVYINK